MGFYYGVGNIPFGLGEHSASLLTAVMEQEKRMTGDKPRGPVPIYPKHQINYCETLKSEYLPRDSPPMLS